MAYDGGGSASWNGYHKTYIVARLAAFCAEHITSWGGGVTIHNQRDEGWKKGYYN